MTLSRHHQAGTSSGGMRAAPTGLPSSRRKLNVAHALGCVGVKSENTDRYVHSDTYRVLDFEVNLELLEVGVYLWRDSPHLTTSPQYNKVWGREVSICIDTRSTHLALAAPDETVQNSLVSSLQIEKPTDRRRA